MIKLQTCEILLGIEKTRQKDFCRVGWNYKKFAVGTPFFQQVEHKAVEDQNINRVFVKIIFPNPPFGNYFLAY